MSDDPYHMQRPDLAEAEAAVYRLYGHESAGRWQSLLAAARLTGHETEPDAVERVVEVMLAADPVTALCGRGLAIRIRTYEYLLSAASIIQEAR